MSEYGQICPRSFARNTIPEIPPASAIPIGNAKLRISIDITSCDAAITIPPNVPKRHHIAISFIGSAAVMPTIYPDITNRTPIHISLISIIKVIMMSFAANIPHFDTGIVSVLFQL